jgi:hypothetical protein
MWKLHQMGPQRAPRASKSRGLISLLLPPACLPACPRSQPADLKNLQIVANLSHMKQSTQKAVMAASTAATIATAQQRFCDSIGIRQSAAGGRGGGPMAHPCLAKAGCRIKKQIL